MEEGVRKILGVVVSLMIVSLFLIAIIIYFNQDISFGANIDEYTLLDEGTALIKLSAGANLEEITSVIFVFNDSSGKSYLYETTSGAQNLSVPYTSFLFWKSLKGEYVYPINASDVGLENFKDITSVGVIFKYGASSKEPASETTVLNIQPITDGVISTASSSKKSRGGGSGGGKPCISQGASATCGLAVCGQKTDNCGKVVSCGSCLSGYLCNSAGQCEQENIIVIPSCSEGLVSSTCVCQGVNRTSGYCCSGNYQTTSCAVAPSCTLSSAYWNQTSALTGTLVKMITYGINCNSNPVNFTIKKVNGLLGVDFLWPDSSVLQSSGTASLTWLAGKGADGTFSAGEYYFEARLADGTGSINTKDLTNGKITVTASCVPSLTCANYINQCGVNFNNGCTNSLDCSNNCGSGKTCSSGVCVINTCTDEPLATTCGAWVCGNKGNNCGKQVSCGVCSGGLSCDGFGSCVTSTTPNPLTTNKITKNNITWTFDKNYTYGQFVNGDYWVVGPVNITSISPGYIYDKILTQEYCKYDGYMVDRVYCTNFPAPFQGKYNYSEACTANKCVYYLKRNGYMINPLPSVSSQTYDARVVAYNVSDNPATSLPRLVGTSSSVVSVISLSDSKYKGDWTAVSEAEILTVLLSTPPADAFRPGYTGNVKTLYSSSGLRSNLLLSLPPTAGAPSLATLEREFRSPWIDHLPAWSGQQIFPSSYMPSYGSDVVSRIGEAALVLQTNYSLAQKQNLLVYLVQLGIDRYESMDDGMYWEADGGHQLGAKFPIIFAGYMLNNTPMMGVYNAQPYGLDTFAEDCQIYYDDSSFGATFHGVQGFPRWGIRHCQGVSNSNYNDETSGYRTCCTSDSEIGQTLVLRLLKLEKVWGHQAYFDYEDRWMQSGEVGAHGSAFSENMWNKYRSTINTCNNGVWDKCSINCNAATGVMSGETGVDIGGGCGASLCTNGQTQSCLTGQSGICSAGTQTCSSGAFGACTRNSNPTTEVCGNGIDEDCSGADLTCTVEVCDLDNYCESGETTSCSDCDNNNLCGNGACSGSEARDNCPIDCYKTRNNGNTYSTTATIYSELDSLISSYPTKISKEVVGYSLQGRPFYIYKIGNSAGGKFMFDGRLHGHEDCGTEIGLEFVKWVLNSNTAEANRILRNNYLLFVPIINIDITRRQNAREINPDGTKPLFGVDLNRNFGNNWASASSSILTDKYYYKGSSSESEPETQGMSALFTKYKPTVYLNGHCGDNAAIYYTGDATLNNKIIADKTTIATQRGSDFNTYHNDGTTSSNMAGGAFSDAVVNHGVKSAWLIEIAYFGDMPSTRSAFINTFYNRTVPIYLAMAHDVEICSPVAEVCGNGIDEDCSGTDLTC